MMLNSSIIDINKNKIVFTHHYEEAIKISKKKIWIIN